mgnify:CR=1 FL=1
MLFLLSGIRQCINYCGAPVCAEFGILVTTCRTDEHAYGCNQCLTWITLDFQQCSDDDSNISVFEASSRRGLRCQTNIAIVPVTEYILGSMAAILLCCYAAKTRGGQSKDIQQAKVYWKEYLSNEQI